MPRTCAIVIREEGLETQARDVSPIRDQRGPPSNPIPAPEPKNPPPQLVVG